MNRSEKVETYTCTDEDTVEASTRFALNLKDFFFFPFLLAKKAAVSAAVSVMVAVRSSFRVTNLGL
jgi:hypothetical protein